jgi:hypothetical protein
MTDYYLMPTKWSREGKCESALDHADRIRLVNCSHQKKRKAEQDYERELNSGKTFEMEAVVKDNKSAFCVVAVPYNQARGYNTFHDWPCNKDMF